MAGDGYGRLAFAAAQGAGDQSAAAAAGRNRAAIGTFASLLKQLFRDDATRSASDRGMLENIVLPALMVPAQDSSNAAPDLATLLNAKGRLIERNPTAVFLSIEG